MTISVSRPHGSSHFLRFQGTLDVAAGAAGYGQLPGPVLVPGAYTVKFLMGLASTYVQPPGSLGPLDPDYRLPNRAYDNPLLGASVPDTNWAQNTIVTVRALDGNLTACELDAVEWEYDVTTGLPVLVLDMTVIDAPEVDVQVEVKHSTGR